MTHVIESTVPATTNAMRILAYKPGAPTITWNVTEDSANARLHPDCKDFLHEDWRQFVFRSEGAVNTSLRHGSVPTTDMGRGECGSIILFMTLYEWPGKKGPVRHRVKVFPALNEPGVTVDMILQSVYMLLQEAYEEEKRTRADVSDWATFITDKLDQDVSFAGLVATDLPYVYDVILVQPAVTFIHTEYPYVHGSNGGYQGTIG